VALLLLAGILANCPWLPSLMPIRPTNRSPVGKSSLQQRPAKQWWDPRQAPTLWAQVGVSRVGSIAVYFKRKLMHDLIVAVQLEPKYNSRMKSLRTVGATVDTIDKVSSAVRGGS